MNINPFDVLKNAQKIQEQMSVFQQKLETLTATGAAGGGLVEIEMNGKLEVISVHITPQAMEGGDVEMLEDLIMAAFTDGITKVKELIASETAAGLNLAGFPGVS